MKSETKETAAGRVPLTFPREFSQKGTHPYQRSCGRDIDWSGRLARITNHLGEVKFERDGLEFPAHYSDLSVGITGEHYFAPQETSLRQVIDRIVDTVSAWGLEDGYFDKRIALVFNAELKALIVNQRAAFNSPVWYNLGIEEICQLSACFIQGVVDSIDDPGGLLDLQRAEAKLFKHGSGTGTNFSAIRSSKEGVTGGGVASGPVSFCEGYDAWAGTVRSGGKTRRAAKMIILNADHPDIAEFVGVKAKEEDIIWSSVAAGVFREDLDWAHPDSAQAHAKFQNGNFSVRATDGFMRAVAEPGALWGLKAVTTGETIETVDASKLMDDIAVAAWRCADPGMQWHDAINRFNKCSRDGEIVASNPCSEFNWLNDSACNLGSVNLLAFLGEDGLFDLKGYELAVRLMATAMDIFVHRASYPTERIRENSLLYRPLGLGYGNLGALLMCSGLPYDSPEGRRLIGAVTSFHSAVAHSQSARIAAATEPFPRFEANRKPFMAVMGRFLDSAREACRESWLVAEGDPRMTEVHRIGKAGEVRWLQAIEETERFGARNAQSVNIAPCGTIGFEMDLDTFGFEPDFSIVKTKKTAQGGHQRYVNQAVPQALRRLGYTEPQVVEITAYVDAEGTVEKSPCFNEDHLAVFDTSGETQFGRSIHWKGHILAMAAAQPFICGAISKTVNMPNSATVADVREAYAMAWELGLKCLAIYRDGCKRGQPLSAFVKKAEAPMPEPGVGPETLEKRILEHMAASPAVIVAEPAGSPVRRRLPRTRPGVNHKVAIGGADVYFQFGFNDKGEVREVFTTVGKVGSTMAGFLEVIGVQLSMMLQYQIPLEAIVEKFKGVTFEPRGFTDDTEIRTCTSIIDYLVRWLERHESSALAEVGLMRIADAGKAAVLAATPVEVPAAAYTANGHGRGDQRICSACGSLTPASICFCMTCSAGNGCA